MSGYKPNVAITIPKPCSESWEAMAGNARVRHCGACDRDVRNLATMTPPEIEAMLAAPGPLPCMRIVQYQDGSLLTARVEQKPGMLHRASMMLSTVMLMAGSAAAQSSIGSKDATLTGRVVDQTGASIPRASVELSSGGKTVARTETDVHGDFSVQANAGEYRLRAIGPGFSTFEMQSIALHAGVQKAEPIALLVGVVGGPVLVSQDQVQMAVETPLITSTLSYAQSEIVVRKGDGVPPGNANAAILRGKVVDSGGLPVAHAKVEFSGRAKQVITVETDKDGVFVFSGPKGSYAVDVSDAKLYENGTMKVTLPAGVRELRKPIRLSDSVTVVVGEPIGDVKYDSLRTKKVASAPDAGTAAQSSGLTSP